MVIRKIRIITRLYCAMIIAFVFPIGCISQNVGTKFVQKELKGSGFTYERVQLPKINFDSFYDLTQNLPDNYVQDGSVDYTSYLQKGISSQKKVKLPDFPVLINDSGLTLSNGQQMFFPEHSTLILKPSDKERYEILRLHNVSNVTLYNPKIKGDRGKHKGSTGEWGMGISIRASSDITIFNPNISDCWGDGIYLGHLRYVQNQNIKIYNGYLNNNRRNGVSVTSGNNVLIEQPYIMNTNGAAPASGIVIEASNDVAELNGIIIKNALTYNNVNSGIRIGGFEKLIGKAKTPINIEIENHTDIGSRDGVFIGRILSPERLPGPGLEGSIRIINPRWESNKNSDFTKRSHYGRGPTIVFSKLNSRIKSRLTSGLKSDRDVKFEN